MVFAASFRGVVIRILPALLRQPIDRSFTWLSRRRKTSGLLWQICNLPPADFTESSLPFHRVV